jgi:aryl-alcohol dehydrogenase-like predicted oxidoreductase
VQRRALGRTGFEISVVGFGAWEIGGPGGALSWRAQDDALSIRAIHAALDAGIDWIDTAPAYGLGHSEEVVGRALRSLRERPLVFTKCGLVWDGRGEIWSDLSAASVRDEVTASLRRLGVEALDLVHVHWPFPDRQLEEAWETLDDLRREGLVRAVGGSNFDVAQVRRAQRIAPVAAVQPPYSLVRREAEAELLPFCAAEGIGVVAYSPLASGLLTMTRERMQELPPDDWRHLDPMFREPHLTEHLAVAGFLRELAAARGVSPAAAAIAWTLRNPAVTGAIVGISRPEQVPAAAAAAALALSHADARALDERVGATLALPRPPDRFEPRERPAAER